MRYVSPRVPSGKEIRYLEINSPTGAYVSLFIEAYVRIPDKNAVYDSYLEFKTSSGTIRLEGKTLTFENDISDILVKAGFEVSTGVSSTLRRLATAHQLMGLFNSISASDLQDWPGMDPLPKIPTTYHATFQMGYSCQSKTGDRCENCKFRGMGHGERERERERDGERERERERDCLRLPANAQRTLTSLARHPSLCSSPHSFSQMRLETGSPPAGLASSGRATCPLGKSPRTCLHSS